MNKEVEKSQGKIKKTITDRIGMVAEKQANIVEKMKNCLRILGIENIEIPRTAVTVSNKLVEINKELNKEGYDIYSYYNEKYNIFTMPIIGEAIINDLIDRLANSVKKIDECQEIIEKIINRETKLLPVKRAFFKIKSIFGKAETTSYINPVEEKEIIDKIKEYKKMDSEIWTYNLEEILVPAILNEISKYRKEDISELLEIEVKPYLKALKLEHLEEELDRRIAIKNNIDYYDRSDIKSKSKVSQMISRDYGSFYKQNKKNKLKDNHEER